MKKRQFIHILRKYRQGTATSQEQHFIESYYHLFETEPGLDAWLDEEGIRALKDQTLEAIWEKIRDEENGPDHRIRKLVPARLRAAAAILILLTAGLLLWIGTHHKKTQVVSLAGTAPPGDITPIRPGGNRAVLTLANGSRVFLGAAQNGLLARQGVTRIIKLDSSRVAYQKITGGSGKEGAEMYNTITTPRGGQYEIILPDGTGVWLNAASSLRFPAAFSGNSRRVRVNGEAYFEVAPAANKPFIVEAGKTEVQVLGTNFNINAYDEENFIETTLAQGSVKVINGGVGHFLIPGQQAGLDKQTGAIQVKTVNVKEFLAWKNGLFYFDHTNIKAIMREVSRWYDVDVQYVTGDLNQKDFSGIISRYSDVGALLKRLELTGTVHFKVEGRKITVLD